MKAKVILAAALVLFVSCAKNAPEDITIEHARRDSELYCSERSKEGCDFSVVKTPSGWGVMAMPILRSENGERGYVPGAWRSYSYDDHGKLTKEMPGL
jgi:hypothetical protein